VINGLTSEFTPHLYLCHFWSWKCRW